MCANNSAPGDGKGTSPAVWKEGSPGFRVCILSVLMYLCQISIITLSYTLVRFPSQHTKYMFIAKKQSSEFTLLCTHFLKYLAEVSM